MPSADNVERLVDAMGAEKAVVSLLGSLFKMHEGEEAEGRAQVEGEEACGRKGLTVSPEHALMKLQTTLQARDEEVAMLRKALGEQRDALALREEKIASLVQSTHLSIEALRADGQLEDTLRGTLFLDVCGVQGTLDIPPLPHVKHLILVDSDPQNTRITHIGDSFLYKSDSCLETLDLTLLTQLTSVGKHFLRGCVSLTALDLPLSQVTSVGECFLYGCASLTTLDLTLLSQVTSVGDHFLRDCTSLTSLHLPPLSRVTSVGDCFLYGCTSIATLDLTPLSQVTRVGDFFLHSCASLTTLDLKPFSQVTKVGGSFLFRCTSLPTLDLASLSQVTSIGEYFLRGCTSLALDLTPLAKVTDGSLLHLAPLVAKARV